MGGGCFSALFLCGSCRGAYFTLCQNFRCCASRVKRGPAALTFSHASRFAMLCAFSFSPQNSLDCTGKKECSRGVCTSHGYLLRGRWIMSTLSLTAERCIQSSGVASCSRHFDFALLPYTRLFLLFQVLELCLIRSGSQSTW